MKAHLSTPTEERKFRQKHVFNVGYSILSKKDFKKNDYKTLHYNKLSFFLGCIIIKVAHSFQASNHAIVLMNSTQICERNKIASGFSTAS